MIEFVEFLGYASSALLVIAVLYLLSQIKKIFKLIQADEEFLTRIKFSLEKEVEQLNTEVGRLFSISLSLAKSYQQETAKEDSPKQKRKRGTYVISEETKAKKREYMRRAREMRKKKGGIAITPLLIEELRDTPAAR